MVPLSVALYYYTLANRDKLLDTMRTSKITDIEDLAKFGRDNRFTSYTVNIPYFRACAYYLSREVKSDAEILFMPYNYLLDVKVSQVALCSCSLSTCALSPIFFSFSRYEPFMVLN